ncbi:hypothetical protein SUBVAR_06780 [Subdoligranulum variabile DSM 15176]|uniref:Uncharacterized protein n=1 Tax=Subdoligranulum variabile DSM 15176 TaxID=411471 RepID=D1PQV3_9FIRM|nr:hypothetical protein SUBVAR_06780 [Subdoligranulum variabile DSM 15176]
MVSKRTGTALRPPAAKSSLQYSKSGGWMQEKTRGEGWHPINARTRHRPGTVPAVCFWMCAGLKKSGYVRQKQPKK